MILSIIAGLLLTAALYTLEGVAELVDALASGASGGNPWRFKYSPRHYTDLLSTLYSSSYKFAFLL